MAIDHDLRRMGVGASEVAAVLGLSPYQDAFDVYVSKVYPIKRESTVAMRRGKYLERGIAEWAAEDLGLSIEWFDKTVVHPTRTWQLASPDAWILEGGSRAAELQIKTVGWREVEQYGEGGDDIPSHVFIQVQWTMSAADTPYAMVAALCGLDDLRTYRVARDYQIEAVLLEEIERWWRDHVLARKPPPIGATPAAAEYLKQRFPKNVEALRTATPDEHNLLLQLKDVSERLDLVDKECTAVKNAVKLAIGDGDGLLDGPSKVTWKKDRDSTGTDFEAVAKALHAEAIRLGSSIELSDLLKDNQVVTRKGPRKLLLNFK